MTKLVVFLLILTVVAQANTSEVSGAKATTIVVHTLEGVSAQAEGPYERNNWDVSDDKPADGEGERGIYCGIKCYVTSCQRICPTACTTYCYQSLYARCDCY